MDEVSSAECQGKPYWTVERVARMLIGATVIAMVLVVVLVALR